MLNHPGHRGHVTDGVMRWVPKVKRWPVAEAKACGAAQNAAQRQLTLSQAVVIAVCRATLLKEGLEPAARVAIDGVAACDHLPGVQPPAAPRLIIIPALSILQGSALLVLCSFEALRPASRTSKTHQVSTLTPGAALDRQHAAKPCR